jgi:hypothetical protein
VDRRLLDEIVRRDINRFIAVLARHQFVNAVYYVRIVRDVRYLRVADAITRSPAVARRLATPGRAAQQIARDLGLTIDLDPDLTGVVDDVRRLVAVAATAGRGAWDAVPEPGTDQPDGLAGARYLDHLEVERCRLALPTDPALFTTGSLPPGWAGAAYEVNRSYIRPALRHRWRRTESPNAWRHRLIDEFYLATTFGRYLRGWEGFPRIPANSSAPCFDLRVDVRKARRWWVTEPEWVTGVADRLQRNLVKPLNPARATSMRLAALCLAAAADVYGTHWLCSNEFRQVAVDVALLEHGRSGRSAGR